MSSKQDHDSPASPQRQRTSTETPESRAQSQHRAETTTFTASTAPALSLPKGGGAIRALGEKFTANPATGTGSLSVPLPVNPGRNGFGPQLTLTYDSGAGNGPFGLGWSLSLPAITRKTDKGLPQYQDGQNQTSDSDVFVLSGAEDLVPLLNPDGTITETPRDGYLVRQYQPRVEGLFARIERWLSQNDPTDVFWRSISKDNITTLYGATTESRICDPARIFSWLICQSYDDKGNAIVYRYAAENERNLDLDQANERNRLRTVQRYPKRVLYGNRTPNRDLEGRATDPAQLDTNTWMFELVFDYGEGHLTIPDTPPDQPLFVTVAHDLPKTAAWAARRDPFSSYRSGFEVRTYRLCQRVLMFHHFPAELGVDSCLVRSTDFSYREDPVASFITTITQSGYLRQPTAETPHRYLRRSLPPLVCRYSEVPSPEELAERPVHTVDVESLENLPTGLDGTLYQWVDLDGDGVAGLLTEQGDAWFYKRNLSPLPPEGQDLPTASAPRACFAALERVATRPVGGLRSGQAQLMDLAGDGQPDLVMMEGPLRGFFERTSDEGWSPFRTFRAWPNLDTRDPNLKFVDLDGDGHADILISEQGAFVWHPSLAEDGFGPAQRTLQSWDEEHGPHLVFADGTQSIYLADLSGDGLTDLVRIRNGEVCYWPNQGYGRFGAKVTMDNPPWFEAPDLFEQKRIRLADIDGSGVTDIIYLSRSGVQVYYNQSGNAWSAAQTLPNLPPIDNLSAVQALDLLGNGTACLVWSSPLPGNVGHQLRYLDLMGGKPHLLISTANSLGAETVVRYAPSTRFYLEDKLQGRPWISKLPFPVHVVERVEIYDRISRSRFVSRYAYHHGFFDGVEREFRGFGMVEQWDTEEIGSVAADQGALTASNHEPASFVPPIYTKSWFHTGVYLGREAVSSYFDELTDPEHPDRSYRQPGWSADDARRWRLPDTVLPEGLTLDEERQACRALKGMLLRQEVYGQDGTNQAKHPYTVTEQTFAVERLQPQAQNRHAVFFTYPGETLSFHYERNPADPRIAHTITLETDDFGNVLKSVAVGYGRAVSPLDLPADRERQTGRLITYTENTVTNRIDAPAHPDDYRAPLPVESRTYELTGYSPADGAVRFQRSDFVSPAPTDQAPRRQRLDFDSELSYEQTATTDRQRRLIEQIRTLYRADDLGMLLPLGTLEALALPGESYKLAFTPGLLELVFRRARQALLPNRAVVLAGQGSDQGGYVDLDGDGRWWIPSGRVFFSETPTTPAAEQSEARQRFFLPQRFSDPFGHSTTVVYDAHNLLAVRTKDPLNNMVEALYDYRVLQPRRITDPNRNRSEAAFDALGMLAGTALMGKDQLGGSEGDSLAGFAPELTPLEIAAYFDAVDPRPLAVAHLGNATTRIIYDLSRVPACTATIARETHVSDLAGAPTKVQLSFGYSDGFDREMQKKIQAEPGPVPKRNADGSIIVGADGRPEQTEHDVSPRWVGSGWTVFNNKGKPVRQFEPFFSDTHRLDADTRIGVSPWLFYNPAERVVLTLHPNHTWEKVVFDPWQQASYDVNDTLLHTDGTSDPRHDPDVGGFFARLPEADYLPTWYEQCLALAPGDPERTAAEQAAVHRQTPTQAHFDALGRPFLTIAQNRFERDGAVVEEQYATRVELDIEGNQRAVRDALEQNGDQRGRVVMSYSYDMLGNRIVQESMEAGTRWTLADAAGKPIRAWDSRGFARRMAYDALRRQTGLYISAGGTERLAERIVYGEGQGEAGNHRTRIYQVFDGAGVVTNEDYDFKGNLLHSRRDLLPGYKQEVDWQLEPATDDGGFSTSTSYDALNRPIRVTTPDGSDYLPTFNEANLLDRVEVRLRGAATATTFVSNIDYDAKGQRERIVYGNGARTTYRYDPLTFRLLQLRTTRAAAPDAATSQLFRDAGVLQDLRYTYDPGGNITRIADAALETVIFNGQQAAPACTYRYDAVYRLTEATGREHIGQTTRSAGAPDGNRRDRDFAGLADLAAHPNNLQALRSYTERYAYDAVGNFLTWRHEAGNNSWTRSYEYGAASLTEPSKQNNRLTATRLGDTVDQTFAYTDAQGADVHGCITAINSMRMLWDSEDQLQQVDLGGGGTVYYVYDAGGQRVRKVIERQNGTRQEERIYLGGFEVYRRFGSDALTRETLHIMDDQQRIALVETRTQGSEPDVPAQAVRYQHANHLGSASLELDAGGALVSYEEYHPYGTSALQVGRAAAEVSLKRYRYTSKERDAETGFSYHGARYYAPWMGRWASCDPNPSIELTLYAYSADNPIRYFDPDGRAECDTSNVNPQTLAPSNDKLNKLVNDRIAAARTASGIVPGVTPTDEQRKKFVGIVSKLGIPRGGSESKFNAIRAFFTNSADPNKTEIEKIAAKDFPNQDPGQKYQLAEEMGQSGDIGVAMVFGTAIGMASLHLIAFIVKGAMNPSIVLMDNKGNRIPVGTDKLGHFFAQGFQEFETSVLEGKGDAAAEKQSFEQEKTIFGLGTTGVFSNADREANKLGREFYKKLYADPFMTFDIANYANWNLNEVMNPNVYSEEQEDLLITSGKLPASDRAVNKKKLDEIKNGIIPNMEPIPR